MNKNTNFCFVRENEKILYHKATGMLFAGEITMRSKIPDLMVMTAHYRSCLNWEIIAICFKNKIVEKRSWHRSHNRN
jgi:hypothetical protein